MNVGVAAVEAVEVGQEELARHRVARADHERAGLERARLLELILARFEKADGAAHIFK